MEERGRAGQGEVGGLSVIAAKCSCAVASFLSTPDTLPLPSLTSSYCHLSPSSFPHFPFPSSHMNSPFASLPFRYPSPPHLHISLPPSPLLASFAHLLLLHLVSVGSRGLLGDERFARYIEWDVPGEQFYGAGSKLSHFERVSQEVCVSEVQRRGVTSKRML